MPTTTRQHVTRVEFTDEEVLAMIRRHAAEVMGCSPNDGIDVACTLLDDGVGSRKLQATAVMVTNV